MERLHRNTSSESGPVSECSVCLEVPLVSAFSRTYPRPPPAFHTLAHLPVVIRAKLVLLNNRNVSYCSSRSMKFKVDISGLTPRCQQDHAPSGGSRRESLPLSASGGHWHSLVCGCVSPIFLLLLCACVCVCVCVCVIFYFSLEVAGRTYLNNTG